VSSRMAAATVVAIVAGLGPATADAKKDRFEKAEHRCERQGGEFRTSSGAYFCTFDERPSDTVLRQGQKQCERDGGTFGTDASDLPRYTYFCTFGDA